MSQELRAADVFLTRGTGLLSRTIRFFTRSLGESRTKVNHSGIIVEGGVFEDAVAVEALTIVKRHGLFQRYGNRRIEVAVYRPLNITEADIRRIVEKAEGYVGRKYGYFKLLLHLADWALLGAYLFRRLARMDRYPICSWLVAHSYKAAGLHFGVAPGAATPDDIWDFVTNRTDRFEEIHPLKPLND